MKTKFLARLVGAALAGAFILGLPVALSAQTASSYVTSANQKFRDGDFDAAIADYTKALDLNSSYFGAYNGRGLAKSNQGNFDGAIADFNLAIKLKPALVDPYFNRGNAEFLQGNFDAAVADFTKVTELKADHQAAYFHRALARDCQMNIEGAAADYAKALSLKATDDETTDYLALHSALLNKRLGRDNSGLLGGAAGWHHEWPKALAAFMNGKVSESALLKLADTTPGDSQAQRCQALYFIGAMKVISGNKAGARSDFQQCVNQSGPASMVHRLAQAELDRH